MTLFLVYRAVRETSFIGCYVITDLSFDTTHNRRDSWKVLRETMYAFVHNAKDPHSFAQSDKSVGQMKSVSSASKRNADSNVKKPSPRIKNSFWAKLSIFLFN